ncbi:sensor protein [Halorubrum sp. BOL3-1]|nr:sensor protein [Halorubrum sp. BOL3-1]
MANHVSQSNGTGSRFRWLLGVPFRAQTYRNVAFLLLAFPLGVSYFVAVTVGLSVGAGLSVTLVGIPLVLVTLLAVGYIGRAEALLASWLLPVAIDAPEVPAPTTEDDLTSLDGLATVAGRLVASRITRTSLAYVLLKFVFGVVAFTVVVTAFSIIGSLLAMPFLYDAPNAGYSLGSYTVDSLEHALVGGGLGVVLLFAVLHLLNGLARLGGVLAETLLASEADSVTAVKGEASQ